MKFTIDKSLFEESLNIVERAISNRNTLPVLNNVFLNVEKGKLTLTTTNLEIAIKTSTPIENSEDGKTTIPVKLLSSYISLLKSQKVVVDLKERETLHLKAEESDTKIKGISPEEFPLIPEIKTEKSIKIPVKDFIKHISKIVFASALDELRPVLAGVFVKIENGNIFTVATDSYRLVETKRATTEKNDISLIIPSRTILELSRILHKHEDKDVKIDISKNQIRFTCEKVELISRLIEGQYPDYTKIIPEKVTTTTIVNTQELITSIKRASLFAREKSNSIKLEVGKNNINIVVDSVQTGSERAVLKAKTEGEDKTIAFNAQYLIDTLTNIETEEVEIGINSSITPGVVRPKGNTETLHIIMPLKV